MIIKIFTRGYARILLVLGGFLMPVFKRESIDKYDKSYKEPRNK